MTTMGVKGLNDVNYVAVIVSLECLLFKLCYLVDCISFYFCFSFLCCVHSCVLSLLC